MAATASDSPATTAAAASSAPTIATAVSATESTDPGSYNPGSYTSALARSCNATSEGALALCSPFSCGQVTSVYCERHVGAAQLSSPRHNAYLQWRKDTLFT